MDVGNNVTMLINQGDIMYDLQLSYEEISKANNIQCINNQDDNIMKITIREINILKMLIIEMVIFKR